MSSASSERRVTVHGGLYPLLQEWAERDRLTVADVVNAILLQTIRPYGVAPYGVAPYGVAQDCPCAATTDTQALHAIKHQQATAGQQIGADPYQTAMVDSW